MGIKIGVDAGHGSQTAGKRTPSGYREHWANVKVANYFVNAMERCGIDYIKVGWNDENATDDVDISLSTRQQIIKDAKCDYSISWHFNACGDGKTYNSAKGISVYISDKDACVGDSAKMAKYVHDELIKGTKQNDRKVNRKSLSMCNCYVMKTKASILVECAFMTNKEEEELMKSDAFCKECAEEGAKGFCEYIGVKYVADNGQVTTATTTKTTSGVKYVYKGVDYSLVFDPSYYASLHADLKSAFGNNATKLFDHFCNYGMVEGRKAIATFDVKVYRAKYADLQKAFGANLPKYYEHYIKYGHKENRVGV